MSQTICSSASSQGKSSQRPVEQTNICSTSSLRDDFGQDKVCVVRFNCMQSWFFACSSTKKEFVLNALLEKLCDAHLLVVLKALDYRRDKIDIYSLANQTTNLIYDRKLKDHNRSLEENVLEKTIKADVEWYGTLSESEQIFIIFQLLKLSGSAIIRNTFDKALIIHRQRQETSQIDLISQPTQFLMGVNFLNPELQEKLVQPYGPDNPYTVQVENARKMWNDAFDKYRNQVEGKPEQPKNTSEEKSKQSKISKNTKSSKRTSKSKESTSISKAKVDQEHLMIDRVQLLPIWIVKQIFSYLDQNTLQKVKAVNIYWAYAVADLLKEKDARKFIENTMKKLESTEIDETNKVDEFRTKVSRISPLDKRLEKLSYRGAVHPKLRTINCGGTNKKSLVKEATAMRQSEYKLPVRKLEIFPRNNPADDSLHKAPSCILNEVAQYLSLGTNCDFSGSEISPATTHESNNSEAQS